MTGVTIGQAARGAGVGIEPVRFYERQGLIAQLRKPDGSGVRHYSEDLIERIRFVREANLLIFHTVVGMTRALDSLIADGHGTAITSETLAGTSPYLNEHLNRFGSYELDLNKPLAPLPFELPARARPTSPATFHNTTLSPKRRSLRR